jgi:hypothetical protein
VGGFWEGLGRNLLDELKNVPVLENVPVLGACELCNPFILAHPHFGSILTRPSLEIMQFVAIQSGSFHFCILNLHKLSALRGILL